MTLKFYSLQSMASNKFTVPVSGLSNITDANISGTTGSPTTATYTSGGVNYKTYKYTGSGSIILSRAGYVDVLLIGGGGSGGHSAGGGGAGAGLITQTLVLPSGTTTITVGAGGGYGYGYNGNLSALNYDEANKTYLTYATGGGAGGDEYTQGKIGANTGGTGKNSGGYVSFTIPPWGYRGGAPAINAGGGGAGAGGNGSDATNNYGGNGGPPAYTTFIDGTSQGFCGGGGGIGYYGQGQGGGAGATAGAGYADSAAANTGSGAGGGGPFSGAGGSGLVVIRVRA